MDPIRIHIPSELFAPAESSHYEGTLSLPVLKSGPDLYAFDEPLHWAVDITNTGDAFLVGGTVEGVAKTSCARCLDDVSLPLIGEIEGYYPISDDDEAPDDMDEDEFDILPADNTIDLMPLIQAALLLEVPLVPLCSDDCKGICPTCGADLNDGPCACVPQQTNDKPPDTNPFAALKNYDFGA